MISSSGLIHSQLRSTWGNVQGSCEVLNTESTKINVLVTLVTHIILFLIMFAGLLHLRRQGGNMPGLWRTLWRQVNTNTFSTFNSLMYFPFLRASFGSFSPL